MRSSGLVSVAGIVGVGAFVVALVALPEGRERPVRVVGGGDGWGNRDRPLMTDQRCEPSMAVVDLLDRFRGDRVRDALAWGEMGWVFRSVGMEESALRAWGEARSRMEEDVTIDGGTATDWYNLACFRALSGAPERALSALRRAVLLGWVDVEYAREDRDLEGLWGMEEFEEALGERAHEE